MLTDAERYTLLCDEIINNLLNESQLSCKLNGYDLSIRELSARVRETARSIREQKYEF